MSWADVGGYVRRDRSLARQTQADYAHRVGLSVRLLGAVERGDARQYSPVTVHRVERALGWAAGSVERVVEGGRPIIDDDPTLARIRAVWARLPAEARTMLAEIAERAARDD